MDYSQFKRAPIEDERSGYVQELLNRLASPVQQSFHEVMNHPFLRASDYYNQINAQENPIPTNPSQMAMGAGFGDIGKPLPKPDPMQMQGLLDLLTPRR